MRQKKASLSEELHGLILMLQAERIAIRQGFIPPHLLESQIALAQKLEVKAKKLEQTLETT